MEHKCLKCGYSNTCEDDKVLKWICEDSVDKINRAIAGTHKNIEEFYLCEACFKLEFEKSKLRFQVSKD
jgi:hypothetical protein